MTVPWRKYILWFAQEHIEFRNPEIQSLLRLFNISMRRIYHSENELPFWLVEFPDESAAKKLASRSISIRCIAELWSHSNKISLLHENIQQFLRKNAESTHHLFARDKTFKINVETYNKHFSQAEKVEKIESFFYLPVKGDVHLKSPDIQWVYIEYYGLDPKNVPDQPEDVLFGKWIADGQRNLIKEISLKKRKFIGNTSMDPQLSLLMANQALARSGDIVFDPFVGTGSLLVSAAKFDAYVVGSDIDYLMLHGKTRPSRISQKVRNEDECVKANLDQYDCGDKYLDVFVSDFSLPVWRDEIIFDSIITDPPYGIREATEKVESKVSTKSKSATEGAPHYPSTSHYDLYQIFLDLLTFSANHLKMNGRLVFWIPIFRNDYNPEILPKHNCMKLLSNSEQILSTLTSRRLLTYEKIKEPSSFDEDTDSENDIKLDFRQKYFVHNESRKERRQRRAELREIGRQEALKRGKILDENGKVVKSNKNQK